MSRLFQPITAGALALAMSGAVAPAVAQGGFVPGAAISWQYTGPTKEIVKGSGVIIKVSDRFILYGPPKTGSGATPIYEPVKPKWSQLQAIRKTGETWKYSDNAKRQAVYEFRGTSANGKYTFEQMGSLEAKDSAGRMVTVRSNWDYVVLDGETTKISTVVTGGAVSFRDPGQGLGDGLRVDYPSRIEGYMAQGDYDMFTFDFRGGTFTARSTGGLNLVADLWDARTGKSIARAIATSGSFSFTMPNLPPGRYGLQMRVMNHAGSGDYGLELGGGGGKVYREVR